MAMRWIERHCVLIPIFVHAQRIANRDALLPRGTLVWQRNYFDRVIRDHAEHKRIAGYIRDNPRNWKGDAFNRRY